MRKLLFNVIFVFCVLFTNAQTKLLQGIVTDAKDRKPIEGAIIIVGGKSAAITASDGSFKVSVASTTKTFKIRGVGFKEQQLAIGTGTVQVSLETEESSLNEVVVTGYQQLQKRQVTGAIANVSGNTIKNAPIGSFDQLLQGQAAGALIQANSGQPGAPARVLIRGVGSINGTTEPLYIVDGVQISAQNFASINPNDFESISLLKDASTTAQYGSRGANGVIVITTKQGKNGKTKFEYNAQYGQSRFPENKLVLMNTNQKLDYEIQRGNFNNWTNAEIDSLRKTNTNWQDEISQTGITNNQQINVSGGNEKTTFFLSGSLFNQSGTIRKTGLKRYSGRLNVDHNANENIKLGIRSYIGWSNSENTTEDNAGIASPLNAIRWANPFERPFDPITGAYQQFASGQPNPVQEMNETNRGTKELKIIASAYLESKLPFILKGLSFRTQWGVDYENLDQTTLFTRFSIIGQAQTGGQGLFGKNARTQNRFTGTSSLNYTSAIRDHNFTVGLFNEFVSTSRSNFGYNAFGLTGNLQNGAGVTNGAATFIPRVTENRTESSIISFFGTGSYSYKNKYFLNTSVRRDGSSRFGANSRFATFYAVGAGWMISDEDFFKSVKFVDNLKLSTSYGTVGNQEGIRDFQSREFFINRAYDGVNGPVLDNLPNPDLTWEERQKFNVGLNASFLRNRITLGVDFYNEITNRLFFPNQLSRATGYGTLNTNVGKVQNRGFEFTLLTENIRTKDFRWTTNINFTINRNKVLELAPTTLPTGVVTGTTITRVGLPLNSNYLVEYAGVNPANGNALYKKLDGTITETFNDVADRQVFGTRDAPYFGGFTNKFTYKNVELSVFFTYLFGNKIYNNDRANVEDPSYAVDNMWVGVAREWQKPGDITNIPRASQIMRRTTSRFIEDGSFLRLRNVQLSYNIGTEALKKVKLSSVRLFIMGENLWTGFKFLGFDPELQAGLLTGAQYPALRTVTAGITIGF
jgi:TonB-dependent starch-binding outer membrane protein SusC